MVGSTSLGKIVIIDNAAGKNIRLSNRLFYCYPRAKKSKFGVVPGDDPVLDKFADPYICNDGSHS